MKKRKGFTLIEMVVVLGIMAILFSYAILTPISIYEEQSIKVVESQVESVIHTAITKGNSYVYDFYIHVEDGYISIKEECGTKHESLLVESRYKVEFENTKEPNILEISEGRVKNVTVTEPVVIKIESEKTNISRAYELSIDGKLIEM